jgi:HEAT repeat protein
MFKKVIYKIIEFNRSKTLKDTITASSQTGTIMQTNKRFEKVLETSELSAIPEVYQLLLSKDEGTKLKSAKMLNSVMSTLNSSQLIKVDKMFRARDSYSWKYNWSNKKPEKLFHPLMTEGETLTILGLSSFHPNGYFREKAIKKLSQMNTGFEIPYLLIRINDWVKEVRNISKENLIMYLRQENAVSFVASLPLVFRLKDCLRNEHDDIFNAIISMISNKESSSELINGLNSTDSKVRLSCYKIILQARMLNNKSIINYLIKEPYSYIRLFVLRIIQKTITIDEFNDISQLLLKDKLAQIRILTLETLYKVKPLESIDILEKSLFDESQAVRELSRYLLSKYKKYDFSFIYRNAVYKREAIYSSICGLGETGNISDAKIIAEFVSFDSHKIVRASLYALAKLDFEGYKEMFVFTLSDCRTGISKAAKRILQGQINSSDEKSIYGIFKESTYEHVKINTCVLLCTLSKWIVIRYILEFCDDENQTISTLGHYALESWKLKFNRSFTTPTKNQITGIRKSILSFGKAVKDSDKEFIEFSIRDF